MAASGTAGRLNFSMEVLEVSEIFLPEVSIQLSIDIDYVKACQADPIDYRIRKLMGMIMVRSLLDLGKNEELAKASLAWISSPEKRYIFSFLHICKALSLDPGQIREVVKRKDFYQFFRKEWHHFSLIDQGILRP